MPQSSSDEGQQGQWMTALSGGGWHIPQSHGVLPEIWKGILASPEGAKRLLDSLCAKIHEV